MKYYKAKKQVQYNKILVAEKELFTEKELQKFGIENRENFTIIELNKQNTFKNFGCRFECR